MAAPQIPDRLANMFRILKYKQEQANTDFEQNVKYKDEKALKDREQQLAEDREKHLVEQHKIQQDYLDLAQRTQLFNMKNEIVDKAAHGIQTAGDTQNPVSATLPAGIADQPSADPLVQNRQPAFVQHNVPVPTLGGGTENFGFKIGTPEQEAEKRGRLGAIEKKPEQDYETQKAAAAAQAAYILHQMEKTSDEQRVLKQEVKKHEGAEALEAQRQVNREAQEKIHQEGLKSIERMRGGYRIQAAQINAQAKGKNGKNDIDLTPYFEDLATGNLSTEGFNKIAATPNSKSTVNDLMAKENFRSLNQKEVDTVNNVRMMIKDMLPDMKIVTDQSTDTATPLISKLAGPAKELFNSEAKGAQDRAQAKVKQFSDLTATQGRFSDRDYIVQLGQGTTVDKPQSTNAKNVNEMIRLATEKIKSLGLSPKQEQLLIKKTGLDSAEPYDLSNFKSSSKTQPTKPASSPTKRSVADIMNGVK